jgi:hypothetical protein
VKPEWLPRDIVAPANEAERDAVRVAQRAVRLHPSGEMDIATKSALRGVQHLFGLPVTGILDEATAERIDQLRPWQVEADRSPVRKY